MSSALIAFVLYNSAFEQTSVASDMFWLCDGLDRYETPVKVVPGPKLRIVAEKASLVASKKEEFEIMPPSVGVSGINQCGLLSGNETLVSAYGTLKQPVACLKFALLQDEQSIGYYALVGKKQRRLGDYKFRIDPKVPTIGLTLSGNTVVPTSQASDVLVFYGLEFLGLSKAGTFSIDARRLIPGYLEFFTIPILKSGEIGPLRMSEIWITTRWELSYPQAPISVEHTTLSAKIGIKNVSIAPIQETWLYLDGTKAVTLASGNGSIDLDLRYVSTGSHKITLVGKCADSRLVAPESFKLQVINPVLDAEKARDRRLAELDSKFAIARRLDQDIVDLYQQALQAPETITLSTTVHFYSTSEWGSLASVTLIDQWQIPGNGGKLMGQCRRRILERASVRVDIGKLLIKLGRLTEAKVWLSEAISDAGESSATATEAKGLLATIR